MQSREENHFMSTDRAGTSFFAVAHSWQCSHGADGAIHERSFSKFEQRLDLDMLLFRDTRSYLHTDAPVTCNNPNTIFGCKYSSSARPMACEDTVGRIESPSLSDHALTSADVVHREVRDYFQGSFIEESSAREIFSIFMLSLCALLKPLSRSPNKVYQDNREHERYDKSGQCLPVNRHCDIEEIVLLLVEEAPELFENKDRARNMLIPAYLYYDLLP